MKRLLAFVLLLLSLFSLSVSAHPGGIDSKGGHYSGSSYHYHHGYPAHQHTGGICPYNAESTVKLKDNSTAAVKSSEKTALSPSASQEKDSTVERIIHTIEDSIVAKIIFGLLLAGITIILYLPEESIVTKIFAILLIGIPIILKFPLGLMIILSISHIALKVIANITDWIYLKKQDRARVKKLRQTETPVLSEKREFLIDYDFNSYFDKILPDIADSDTAVPKAPKKRRALRSLDEKHVSPPSSSVSNRLDE